MRNILAVCTKELYTYFVSPIAYFVCFVFTAISGFLFFFILITASGQQGGTGAHVMATLFGNMAIILLFFTPVLTMKLFAEERKSGTIELLLTSPITDGQVVLGKFFASWALLLIMLALTLFFPLLVQRFGPLDIGALLSGYLGVVLIGSSFLALGLLMSSMCKNQLVAALTSFGILITLWVIGSLSSQYGSIEKFLSYLSLLEHYKDFARGVIVLKDVIYHVSFTGVCLFATFKSIESSKWR
jgi:ABC-2 type transport system permease protein